MWDAIFSTVPKKPSCLLTVISNAGTGEGSSWQWRIREAARESPTWYFAHLDGPQASWITPALLAEQQAMLPPSAYARLWLNQWCSGGGDAIDPGDIAASVTLGGPDPWGDGGKIYVAGLDLGIKHDHSAFVVLGVVPGSGHADLIQCLSWAPGPDRKVSIAEVEAAVLDADRRYQFGWIGFDPNQAEYLAQRLAERGLPVNEVAFTSKSLNRMAVDLLTAFRNKQLRLYRDEALLADLHKLAIVQRQHGFRLVAASDEHGHADRAVALSIALPAALEVANAVPPPPEEYVDYRVIA